MNKSVESLVMPGISPKQVADAGQDGKEGATSFVELLKATGDGREEKAAATENPLARKTDDKPGSIPGIMVDDALEENTATKGNDTSPNAVVTAGENEVPVPLVAVIGSGRMSGADVENTDESRADNAGTADTTRSITILPDADSGTPDGNGADRATVAPEIRQPADNPAMPAIMETALPAAEAPEPPRQSPPRHGTEAADPATADNQTAQRPAITVTPPPAAAINTGTTTPPGVSRPAAPAVISGQRAQAIVTEGPSRKDPAPAAQFTATAVKDATAGQVREGLPAVPLILQKAVSDRRAGAGDQPLPAALKTLSAAMGVDSHATASLAAGPGDSQSAPVSGRIAVPVGEPGWHRSLGEQVNWFVSQNVTSANLRLNPQHLGPLEMQVQVDGDNTSVAFISHNALVRDAVESAIPRLREMFAEQGLNLADVQVSHQDVPDQQRREMLNARRNADATPGDFTDSDTNPASEPGQLPGSAAGLVDYYV